MAYIKLYNVLFTPAASVNQTVRIEYRLASSTGVFTLFSNSVPVLANGSFSPAVVIPNLITGETYTIKITSLCGAGSVAMQDIVAGIACKSYTVTGGLGGATIEWFDCQSGSPLSRFINEGEQFTFCTVEQDGYTTSYGEVTGETDNGNCNN